MAYTITVTEEQKQLIIHALEKFSQLHLGQTTASKEAAGKLEAAVSKLTKYNTVTDLTK